MLEDVQQGVADCDTPKVATALKATADAITELCQLARGVQEVWRSGHVKSEF